MASNKIFSLEGKGLKLDTAEDIEPHLAPLIAQDDVEEVRFWGNTLGVGACKRLGEVLAEKKTLKVCALPRIAPYLSALTSNENSPPILPTCSPADC
jgi:Ran GTPase-activating protein (RanGAP) involved in mRNA processing and transport